jgi:hypothetical protein
MADETKQKSGGKPLTDQDLEDVSGGIIIQNVTTTRSAAIPGTRTVDGGITQPSLGSSGPGDE